MSRCIDCEGLEEESGACRFQTRVWVHDKTIDSYCFCFKPIETVNKPSIKELVENKLKEIDAELATTISCTERTIIWIQQAVWKEVLTMIEENSNG